MPTLQLLISTHAWVGWLLASPATVVDELGAAVLEDRSNVNTGGLCGMSVCAANSKPLLALLDNAGCFSASRPVCWSADNSYAINTQLKPW